MFKEHKFIEAISLILILMGVIYLLFWIPFKIIFLNIWDDYGFGLSMVTLLCGLGIYSLNERIQEIKR